MGSLERSNSERPTDGDWWLPQLGEAGVGSEGVTGTEFQFCKIKKSCRAGLHKGMNTQHH